MAWHKGHFDVVELMLNNQLKDLKFLKIGLEEIENSKKTQNDVKN